MSRFVPAEGPLDARIAYVGEAPGDDEERDGRPFIGPAGYELTRMCRDAGLNRQEAYVTNVIKYHPACNNIEPWISPVKSKKPQPPDTVEWQGRWVADFILDGIKGNARGCLKNELNALKPNLIVALGDTALWALTGKSGISNWRGSLLECNLTDTKIKVIPTYHPAGVLRNWPWREDVVQDLRRARGEMESPEVTNPNWKFTIRPSFEETRSFLLWLLEQLSKGPMWLVNDIETRPSMPQIACTGFAWSKTDAFCIPFLCHERKDGYFSLAEENVVVTLLKEVLEHPNARMIFQNGLYDTYYYLMLYGIRCVPWMDTMLAQHTCFPDKPKSLDYLASYYCQYYSFWKGEGKEWLPRMGEENLWYYNCQDCVYTFEVAEVLDKVLDSCKKREQYKFQMSLYEPIQDVMVRGCNTSIARRDELSKRLAEEILKREQFVEGVLGHPINVRSNPQLTSLFYNDFKIKPIFNRKTGGMTVDDKALELIGRRETILRPITEAISEARSFGVFRNTFVEMEGPRDRLFTSFNIGGTKTFRFASNSNPFEWGTNMQNVPVLQKEDPPEVQALAKEIRRLIIPDKGRILAEWDLERADLCVVVWEANDQDLKLKIKNHADIHTENAKDIGASRAMGKRFIHGTDYGGSARTMGINCGIPERVAKQMQDRWFAKHPGISQWHKRTEDSLRTTRSVSNKFGYSITFYDRPDSVFPEALAWVPQSTVAIVINHALMEIYNRFGNPRMWNRRPPVEILLQVHDSVLVQIEEAVADYYIEEINKIFQNIVVPYDDPLIIQSSCKVSEISWGDMVERASMPIAA